MQSYCPQKQLKYVNGRVVDSTKYKQMIRCLICLMSTRSDLTFSLCLIAGYMERPIEIHSVASKRVLMYLKGTMSLDILHKRSTMMELYGWS